MNIKFITLILLLLPSHMSAKDCSKQKDDLGFYWTQRPIRTQGGGYIWFMGKAVDEKKSTAKMRSEGAALDYLFKECQSIPLKARFIERCEEVMDDKHVVYSRVSIKSDFCKPKSKPNKVLENVHIKYKEYVKKLENSKCSKKNIKICLSQMDELKSNQKTDAFINKAKQVCTYGSGDACFAISQYYRELQDKEETYKYSNIIKEFNLKACNNNHAKSCFVTGLYEQNKEKQISYFEKSCSLKYDSGCIAVAGYNLRQKNKNDASKVLVSYCKKNYQTACDFLIDIFSSSEDEHYKWELYTKEGLERLDKLMNKLNEKDPKILDEIDKLTKDEYNKFFNNSGIKSHLHKTCSLEKKIYKSCRILSRYYFKFEKNKFFALNETLCKKNKDFDSCNEYLGFIKKFEDTNLSDLLFATLNKCMDRTHSSYAAGCDEYLNYCNDDFQKCSSYKKVAEHLCYFDTFRSSCVPLFEYLEKEKTGINSIISAAKIGCARKEYVACRKYWRSLIKVYKYGEARSILLDICNTYLEELKTKKDEFGYNSSCEELVKLEIDRKNFKTAYQYIDKMCTNGVVDVCIFGANEALNLKKMNFYLLDPC